MLTSELLVEYFRTFYVGIRALLDLYSTQLEEAIFKSKREKKDIELHGNMYKITPFRCRHHTIVRMNILKKLHEGHQGI